jgi:hypothetical protein
MTPAIAKVLLQQFKAQLRGLQGELPSYEHRARVCMQKQKGEDGWGNPKVWAGVGDRAMADLARLNENIQLHEQAIADLEKPGEV